MGTVLSFSATRGMRARKARVQADGDASQTEQRPDSGQIYILPVVRIERHGDAPVAQAPAPKLRPPQGPSQRQA